MNTKKIDKYGRIEYKLSYLLLISFLAVLFNLVIGGVLLYIFEYGAPKGNIKTFEDAVWLAYMMISTVGFGDHYPVTHGGRAVGMMCIALGMINLGTFIGLGQRLVKTSSDVNNRQLLIEQAEQTRLLQGIEKAVGIATCKIGPDTHELEEVYKQGMVSRNGWAGWITVGRDSGGTYAMSIEVKKDNFPLKKWLPADCKKHLLEMYEYREKLLDLYLD